MGGDTKMICFVSEREMKKKKNYKSNDRRPFLKTYWKENNDITICTNSGGHGR